MNHLLSRAVRGATAGLVATAVMSAFMVAAERLGVMPGQPPRMIVDRLAPGLRDDQADIAALLSHGAYGAVTGAALAALAGDRRTTSALGIGFGLLVWAGGYEGWVPALGVLPPAHRDRPTRVVVMVAAHMIYGYVLERRLRR